MEGRKDGSGFGRIGAATGHRSDGDHSKGARRCVTRRMVGHGPGQLDGARDGHARVQIDDLLDDCDGLAGCGAGGGLDQGVQTEGLRAGCCNEYGGDRSPKSWHDVVPRGRFEAVYSAWQSLSKGGVS